MVAAPPGAVPAPPGPIPLPEAALEHPADEDAFRALFDATYDDLTRFVQRRVHPLAAEDVVADVYLTAWRRLGDVPAEPGAARAWLFTVARHALSNRVRGDRRQQAVAVRVAGQPAPAGTGEDDAVAARLDLAAAWDRLAERDREVLALTAWDGLTPAEAAGVLGISATAFRVRLVRARRRLRRHLDLIPPTPGASS